MTDQVEDDSTARTSKPRPRVALIVSWVLTVLLIVALAVALAAQSLGGVITTILLFVIVGSVAIVLSLAEASVRSEQRFREINRQ